MKAWSYAVTFELPESSAPVTVRGIVQAGSATRAASISVREAKKAVPRKRWESMVVLLQPQADAAPPAARGGGR